MTTSAGDYVKNVSNVIKTSFKRSHCECSDEQKSVKKNLVKFGTRYIRFMLRARQPLKLLSDACIESRSFRVCFLQL